MSVLADIYKKLFALASHTHTKSQITDFGSYAATDHNHDSTYAAKSHEHAKSDITDFPTFTGIPDYSNASIDGNLSNGGRYKTLTYGFVFFKLSGGGGYNGTATVNNQDLFVVPAGTSQYLWIIVSPNDILAAKESTTSITDIVFVPFK